MTLPQAGIFTEGRTHFYYLEYQFHREAATQDVRHAIRSALAVQGEEASDTVVAFGKDAWDRLNPAWHPEGFRAFSVLAGVDGAAVPSTQRDVLFWIQSGRRDVTMQVALAIHSFMQAVGSLRLDLAGFQYLDSRDLIGFIDGTANPKGDKAREAALIPEGKPGAGGAFVLSQQWVHNLPAFHALSQSEQERVIGRTKPDSIELEGEAMPPTAHVSRTDYKENGKALKIFRRSAPYGTVKEHGLYFLAFSCELRRFQVLLERMFGASGDGVSDKLLRYSKPVTSSYWFAPSREALTRVCSLDTEE